MPRRVRRQQPTAATASTRVLGPGPLTVSNGQPDAASAAVVGAEPWHGVNVVELLREEDVRQGADLNRAAVVVQAVRRVDIVEHGRRWIEPRHGKPVAAHQALAQPVVVEVYTQKRWLLRPLAPLWHGPRAVLVRPMVRSGRP